jgi:NAD(P)H-nitrite reductase large subunit
MALAKRFTPIPLSESQAMKKSKPVMVATAWRACARWSSSKWPLYDITVFGTEPTNYNRILLSPVLAGEQTLDRSEPHGTGT